MSAASEICAYLASHPEATRPELSRKLDIHEKAIETAIRKLVRMGCVIDTKQTRIEGSKRASNIYARGKVVFDQEAFTNFDGQRGRPRKDEIRSRSAPVKKFEFDGLLAAMSGIFGNVT